MRRAAGKRAFQRQGGVLLDEYVQSDGRKMGVLIPGSMVGEPVAVAERAARLEEIGGDDELRAGRAMDALCDEHSPEMLEQLLIALSKQHIGAPSRLVAYADDPRVQPALLAAVRTVPLECVPNFAQGLGLVGGPAARAALRARMHEALAHPQAFAPHEFFNDLAGTATTCAEYLLHLDAEDQDAADALVRLTGHVCGFNRRTAVWHAAEFVERHPGMHTKPLRDLRAALTALIDTPDDDVFCVLAPACWRDPRVPVRVARLLESRSPAKQQGALNMMWTLREKGWPLLTRWAARPRDPILVLTTLGPSLRLLPESRRAEIAKRGLAHTAPTIRREAAFVLGSLDKAVAAKLAHDALKDEPDPAIRVKLMALAKPPRRRASRSQRSPARRARR